MTAVPEPVRIGNCSGFYGDRSAAMREMLTGGDLDYLTGDYLAELTMLILGRDRVKDPGRGYARTFLAQLEDCLGLARDRGVRIVANAGIEPSVVAEKVDAATDTAFGYNAANRTYGDLLQMGVMDPAKVTRLALQNAASIAALVLTTDCMIALPPPERPLPGAAGPFAGSEVL